MIHLDAIQVTFEDHGHKSKVKVMGGKCDRSLIVGATLSDGILVSVVLSW